MFKKIGIGIVVALVVAAVGVGVVLAQGATPVAETPTEASDPVGPRGDHGPGGRGGKHGPMGGGQLDSRASFDALAEALGMTTEELRDALADGQTIAELAEVKGVPLEEIAAALVAEHAERLQQAVEDGRLPQEEADEKIAEMQTNILEQLESGELGHLGGPGGPGGCGGPGGPGGGRRGPRSSDE